MNQADKPLRYLIRHYHAPRLEDGTLAPVEEVIVSYNAQLDRAFEYAINTASRYGAAIYADHGFTYNPKTRQDEIDCRFVRSYAPKRSHVKAAQVETGK